VNIEDAREDLYDLRRNMIRLAEENGLVLVAGATHPFADWRNQEIYPDPRYDKVVEDLQLVARSNLIFGLHVHVGIEDREAAIHIMNSMRYFLPRSGWGWRRGTRAIERRCLRIFRGRICRMRFIVTRSLRRM
jgi:gamma-glutamyl:cysteine ligase YbdK (ATP-grasp superfamily)